MKDRNEKTVPAEKVFDGRSIPCAIKHGMIIQKWLDLPDGDYFVLLNDHDPERLREKFLAEWPGTFKWEHLQKGPDTFAVKITKMKSIRPGDEMKSEPACSCGH